MALKDGDAEKYISAAINKYEASFKIRPYAIYFCPEFWSRFIEDTLGYHFAHDEEALKTLNPYYYKNIVCIKSELVRGAFLLTDKIMFFRFEGPEKEQLFALFEGYTAAKGFDSSGVNIDGGSTTIEVGESATFKVKRARPQEGRSKVPLRPFPKPLKPENDYKMPRKKTKRYNYLKYAFRKEVQN